MGHLRDYEIQVIEKLIRIAPPLLSQTFGRDSCIHATRVLLSALDELDITARPLSVRVAVVNARFLEAEQTLGRRFKDQAEAQQWHRRTGAFSYGIGAIEAPGHWPGHLIVVVRQSALIDLTITQANHPEFNMLLCPLFFEVSGRFLNGRESATVMLNGCKVIYEARLKDRSFMETPAWVDSECLSLAQRLASEI